MALSAALEFARRGWPVFPCNPCQDPPDLKGRKRRSKAPMVAGPDEDGDGKPIPETGGLWRATTDESQIRRWWRKYPTALIGVPTGARTGCFVIDIDPRGSETSDQVLRRLVDAVGPLPAGPVTITQSGGRHLWFKNPEGDLPHNSAKRIPGVDWRGQGGYVIAPPSRMLDGKSYRWSPGPDDIEFPEPPAYLLDLIFQRGAFARGKSGGAAPRPSITGETASARAARRYAQGALDRARTKVADCAPGKRGHTLNAAAFDIGPFVALGLLSEREATAALQDAADTCGLTSTDGATERDRKIARGLTAGRANTAELEGRLEERTKAEARTGLPRYRHADAGAQDGGSGGNTVPPAPVGTGGDEPVDPELLSRLAAEPLNDTGNARRLMAHFGDDMLNVREIGEHRWAETHWERLGGDHAFERCAQSTAERIALEADHLKPSKADAEAIEAARPLKAKPRKDLTDEQRATLAAGELADDRLEKRRVDRRKFATSCGNRARTEAMIKQAKPHITIEPDQLDADAYAINVLNGTLRLVRETVEVEDLECPDPDIVRMMTVKRWCVRLDRHDRRDRMAKVMPVIYDPAATCPCWEAFMARFQPRETTRGFLQRYHGYALTGLMGEQVFLYNYGLGANGKSTFMEALARLQGAYAQVLPAEALTGDGQRRSDQATPEFARLPGARLVRCAELPRGEGFRESTLKMLTGGEPMLVRHLNQGFFEMRPTFKAIGSGNDKPSIKGVDEGIWRRIKLVHWEVTIPLAERRPMETILAEFAAESSGILNWLLAGLIDYLEDGLQVPPEVAEATNSYRNEMDAVGEFMGAHVVEAPGQTVTARTLYEAFVAWCHINSIKPYAEKTFAVIMMQKGVKKESGRVRTYLDIRLDAPPVDPDKPSYIGFRDTDRYAS
jgi:putative DNA primase/helicase